MLTEGIKLSLRLSLAARQTRVFRGNASQLARSGKRLKQLDLRGKSRVVERRISV
jgi:hypothetical protein